MRVHPSTDEFLTRSQQFPDDFLLTTNGTWTFDSEGERASTAMPMLFRNETSFLSCFLEVIRFHLLKASFHTFYSQQQDILWKLYRKCQLPEIKSDKNLIDDFYKVTGAINCYTVSTCNEYLRSRWNRIFKNALTTTPLDWSIT